MAVKMKIFQMERMINYNSSSSSSSSTFTMTLSSFVFAKLTFHYSGNTRTTAVVIRFQGVLLLKKMKLKKKKIIGKASKTREGCI